jgi:hypothetical protein
MGMLLVGTFAGGMMKRTFPFFEDFSYIETSPNQTV